MKTDLIAAAQRLADVLAQENDALKRMDLVAAVALSQAKQAALADFIEHPAVPAPPSSLQALGQMLAKLANENQLLLERAIAVQTRVVRIVARACAPPPAAARYGSRNSRAPSPRAAALALSTRA